MRKVMLLIMMLLLSWGKCEARNVVTFFSPQHEYTSVDLTTFTEEDPGSKITIDSSSQVSWAAVARDNTSYVYKDFGSGYFGGDFTIRYTMRMSGVSGNSLYGLVILSNTVGDARTLMLGYDCITVTQYGLVYALEYREGGSQIGVTTDWTDGNGFSENTDYYVTITRDWDGGSNGTGLYTAYIREGSHTGTLKRQYHVDSSVQNAWQYLTVFGSWNDNDASYSSGYVKNLEFKNSL